MIEPSGDKKSAVATSNGRSRKKKKNLKQHKQTL